LRGGAESQQQKQVLNQIRSTKKHMPQLEDNTYAKFIVYLMGNNSLYPVYSGIELFDVGLWCLHQVKIISFSNVLVDKNQRN